MATKQQVMSFSRVFYSAKDLQRTYGNVFPAIVDTGKLSISVDITYPLPDRKISESQLKKDGNAALTSFHNLIRKQFEKAFSDVEAAKEADSQGDSKAYGTAKTSLDKLNKYIEGKLKSLRVDLRKGMANYLGCESKQLSSSGSQEFVEFKIKSSAFEGDNADAVDTNDYSDLASAIKKGSGKWHFCCVAAHGTVAYIAVDRKKPIKRAEFKDLKKDLGGAVVRLEGICCPKGKSVHMRLLKDSKKQPKAGAMKDGLKSQIGKSWAKVTMSCDLDALPKPSELSKLDSNGNPKSKDGK